MKYDVVTLYTFSMFSLLSGAVVCTQPTELEEVKLRYDDMLKMLGKEEPVELFLADENYWPNYTSDKWPWASSSTEFTEFVRQMVVGIPDSKDKDLQVFTMTAILNNEEIETKYRLSRVKPKVLSQMLLPF
jgi:hypothetical protein